MRHFGIRDHACGLIHGAVNKKQTGRKPSAFGGVPFIPPRPAPPRGAGPPRGGDPPPPGPAPPPGGGGGGGEGGFFWAPGSGSPLHTCAKEIRDASALDFYQAFAHTVRDRLVHRWLATQRTHVERDVKRVCYFSSEFLTGRSLGLCLMNMGLYEAAEALAADRGFDLGEILECEGDPGPRQRRPRAPRGLLHGLAGDAGAARDRLRHPLRLRHVRAEDRGRAARSSSTTTGCSSATPGSCRATRTRRPCASAAASVDHRHTDAAHLRAELGRRAPSSGCPTTRSSSGHRTDTVNTLRLWAARATRDFDLQFFNEGDYRRAVEEKIDTENISKVLYPNDQSEEGKELRLKQQYFFVACSIADIVRRYKQRHATFETPSPTRSRSSSTTPTRRSPSPS